MHHRNLKRSRIKHKDAKKNHITRLQSSEIMQTKHDSRSQSTEVTNELTQQHPVAATEFKMGKLRHIRVGFTSSSAIIPGCMWSRDKPKEEDKRTIKAL